MNEKGKEKNMDGLFNIAIYNRTSKTMSYLFDSTSFQERIRGFYFEQYYDPNKQQIVFNTSKEEYSSDDFESNTFVKKRDVSKNLIIATYSFKTEMTSLWICDKYGKDLKKIAELSEEESYEIDPYNKCIRILKRFLNRNEITEIDY